MSTLACHESVEWPAELLQPLELCWSVTEGPISASLAEWEGKPLDPGAVGQGVLFGPMEEVRFRRLACGKWRLALITDREAARVPGWSEPESIEGLGPGQQDGQVLLWGEWDAEACAWIEGRIPNALAYPVQGSPSGRWRMAVKTCRYRRPAGEAAIERYVSLCRISAERGGA